MKYYIISTIISFISLLAGIYFGVANTDASIKAEYVPMLYTGGGFLISIIAILIADRFSAAENNAKYLQEIQSIMMSSIPSIGNIRRFDSADAALKQIISQMPRAKECWNTRLSPEGVDIGRERLLNFEKAVSKNIRDGLVYHDVITANHKEYKMRMIQTTQGSKGRYISYTLDPGFTVINFIVIKFSDSEFDIYFGWPVGMSSGAEKSVFLSRDMRLIDYFLDYHEMLARSGKSI